MARHTLPLRNFLVVLAAALALISACSGDANSPFDNGYVGGGVKPGSAADGAAATDARPVDGAKLDMANSGTSVGGNGGSGAGGGGGGSTGTAGAGAGSGSVMGTGGAGGPPKDGGGPDGPTTEEMCLACEMKNCQMFRLKEPAPPGCDPTVPDSCTVLGTPARDAYEMCLVAKDGTMDLLVKDGPRKGAKVRDLCREILQCFRSTKCGQMTSNLKNCLCGSATQGLDCNDDAKANGPCKDLAGVGAELGSAMDSATNRALKFFDTTTAVGKATLLTQCDARYCPAECLGLPKADAPPVDGGTDTEQPDTPPPPDALEPDVPLPDAGTDGPSSDAQDASGDAGPEMVQSAECVWCAQAAQNEGNQSCKTLVGCDGIADAADRTLCQKLHRCMLDTGCWYMGPTGKPGDCFCGSATALACTSAPNGVCLAEGMAAAKTTSYLTGSINFFKTSDSTGGTTKLIPAGYASQVFACEVAASCTDKCKVLVPAGSQKYDAGPPDAEADAEPDVAPDVPPDVGSDVGPDMSIDLEKDMSAMPDVSGPSPCVQMCVEDRRGQALPAGCSALMGCDNLTGTDKSLCEALLNCLRAHPSCADTGVASCYCGTAAGLDCNSAPNGVCVNEAVAAAKVPATDFNNGSIRFFNTNFPSGHATQLLVCEKKCFDQQCSDGARDASPDVDDQGTGGSGETGGTGGGGTGGSDGTGGTPGTGGSTGTGGDPGTGGSPATGGAPGTGGSPATGGSPGTGGAPGTGGSPGTGGGGQLCADLDNNGTSDCTQSLVTNSNFASDIMGWTLPSVIAADWVANGAQGAATGAINANNTQFSAGSSLTVVGGPEQCVPATPGNYKVYAESFIASADGTGSVAVGILFYQGAGCTSPLLSGFQTAISSTKDSWVLLQGTATAPAGTASMKVRLGLIKSLGQMSFKATFDNILIAPSP